MKTIVLGLGNPILTDDGVGVKSAEVVRQALPPNSPVEVDEACIGGLELMERMLGYDRVILIDALHTGKNPPGTIQRMTLDDLRTISPTQHSASAHDASLVTALEMAAQMGYPVPNDVTIYAVDVENILDFSDEPTPAVAAAIPKVAAAVLKDLEQILSIDN